jgi:hypothetical protein
MPEPDPMYPLFIEARAGLPDHGGPLLVDIQTDGRPVRFAIKMADVLRFAEWLAMAALGAKE